MRAPADPGEPAPPGRAARAADAACCQRSTAHLALFGGMSARHLHPGLRRRDRGGRAGAGAGGGHAARGAALGVLAHLPPAVRGRLRAHRLGAPGRCECAEALPDGVRDADAGPACGAGRSAGRDRRRRAGGLGAARELLARGYAPTLFEARERAGGMLEARDSGITAYRARSRAATWPTSRAGCGVRRQPAPGARLHAGRPAPPRVPAILLALGAQRAARPAVPARMRRA